MLGTIFLPSPVVRGGPNTFGIAGTSRLANIFLDPSKQNRGNSSFFNWANAALGLQGKRMRIAAHTAVSGSRVDQFDVAGALAPRPRFLIIDGPVNTFAQNYANAADTAALMKADIDRALAQGTDVVPILESGAASMNQSQLGAVNDYNARMEDFAATRAGVHTFDPRPFVFQTGLTNAVAYKAGMSQDGTHTSVLGGQTQGAAFAAFMAPLLSAIPGGLPGYGTESRYFGSAQLTPNPLFDNGTGGTLNGANTGTLPAACWGVAKDGATSQFTVQTTSADAQGNTYGNEVQIAATATAAGQTGFYFSLNSTDPALGDILRFGCEITVASGATNLTSVTASLEMYPTSGQSMVLQDMAPSSVGTDAGGYTIFLQPSDLVIPTSGLTTPLYINFNVLANFAGSGSATITVRKPIARRVFQSGGAMDFSDPANSGLIAAVG